MLTLTSVPSLGFFVTQVSRDTSLASRPRLRCSFFISCAVDKVSLDLVTELSKPNPRSPFIPVYIMSEEATKDVDMSDAPAVRFPGAVPPRDADPPFVLQVYRCSFCMVLLLFMDQLLREN